MFDLSDELLNVLIHQYSLRLLVFFLLDQTHFHKVVAVRSRSRALRSSPGQLSLCLPSSSTGIRNFLPSYLDDWRVIASSQDLLVPLLSPMFEISRGLDFLSDGIYPL